MRLINIQGKRIGEKSPCFIIAEAGANFRISDNPDENFKQALRLIDIAVEAKADAVKFQLYRADKLYVKDAGFADYIGKKKSIYQIIEEMEIPYEWLPKLKQYCDDAGIIFLCSPFDEAAVDELEKINVPAYKIASYTISHIPLLKYIAQKGKPIIMSTGTSTIEDIERAIETIKKEGNDQIALMQCTAKYPAPLSTVNLKVILELINQFNIPVGLSDHSREPYIAPLGAVALGAKIIEKHFTTDNNLPGPDHGFAILDNELIELVKNIRMMENCLGTPEKKIQAEEQELYKFCRRGIYAVKDIAEGDILTKENIAVLRSGKKERGLEPDSFEKILGKKTIKEICKGNALYKGDAS
ncbi:N-acetylneuraminate synthase family protein [Candidatus Woesearchaeota archaeon]|nr:N-acetylneuraminate synthase family protein [Candidatus Woesearchaeota archaeon]